MVERMSILSGGVTSAELVIDHVNGRIRSRLSAIPSLLLSGGAELP